MRQKRLPRIKTPEIYKVRAIDRTTSKEKIAMDNLNQALTEYSNLINQALNNMIDEARNHTPELIEEALSEIAVASGLPEIRLEWRRADILIRKKTSGTPWATIAK